MNAKDIQTLMDYHCWATDKVLRKLTRLSQAELQKPCWLSRGTLMKTLIHMADTEWSWRVACQTGMLPPELTEKDFPDFKTLNAFWKKELESLRTYAGSLKGNQPERTVAYRWPQARPRTKPLWQVLMHLLDHGTQHRAEVGIYLHTLGRSPGDMDFLKFLAARK